MQSNTFKFVTSSIFIVGYFSGKFSIFNSIHLLILGFAFAQWVLLLGLYIFPFGDCVYKQWEFPDN